MRKRDTAQSNRRAIATNRTNTPLHRETAHQPGPTPKPKYICECANAAKRVQTLCSVLANILSHDPIWITHPQDPTELPLRPPNPPIVFPNNGPLSRLALARENCTEAPAVPESRRWQGTKSRFRSLTINSRYECGEQPGPKHLVLSAKMHSGRDSQCWYRWRGGHPVPEVHCALYPYHTAKAPNVTSRTRPEALTNTLTHSDVKPMALCLGPIDAAALPNAMLSKRITLPHVPITQIIMFPYDFHRAMRTAALSLFYGYHSAANTHEPPGSADWRNTNDEHG
ncbi:uncharacterized protein CLUP02_16104 [Colletotrichum lupini]|uniref:Uncharacterized protein n=1 Tax=Colletotrichum lupini TaxID=145971 RepID=A0A9Q8T7B1_9PEZI|nr:uncharacterized protein CLUP02_16104 [Colletotrichum lupini]UQC90574.1 hypothetical protein CLUP02_16104 [Colletotrichum lupini]